MDAPAIVWQRRLPPDTALRVRADGRLVLGDEVVDLATGAPLAAQASAPPHAPPEGTEGGVRPFGVTDQHVLMLALPDPPELFDGHIGQLRRRDSPYVSPYRSGVCTCTDPLPHPNAEDACATCRRQTHFMTFQVYERQSGTMLWEHRWRGPIGEPSSWAAVVVRGTVVLTREGEQVCGRELADGRPLWSTPLPLSRGRNPAWFTGREVLTGSRWAWIDAMDLFVHAPSGRTVHVLGAFHHADDDLVLAHIDTTLTCRSLP